MDAWMNLKRKMEKALELFNLEEALSHLGALIICASSSSEVSSLLRKHTLRRLPTLHYLTGFPYQEEDLPHLERLIRIFTDFGYDINKPFPPGVRKLASHGTTALLASVKKENVILVKCLLRCGARADVRDPEGMTPCHWAIKNGNLKCLETLLEHGGPEIVTSAVDIMALPLLHEAVDNCQLEIVRYLMTKEELGVNVTEEATYVVRIGILRPCTPLRVALEKESTSIIEDLMEHPIVKQSRFKELHSLIEEGDTKNAMSLLKYISDEELCADKIGDRWSLHSIHEKAFKEESRVEFTRKLILEYVRRGWDVNSQSTSTGMSRSVRLFGASDWKVTIDQYNLLHLACWNGGLEIVKVLVEEAGMDINYRTEGKTKMTPLQILLMMHEWESAAYLIEKGADLNLRGNFYCCGYYRFTLLLRKDLITGNLEPDSTFNTVELLIRMGCDDGLALLDELLARPDVKLVGANEFHLAMEGLNPIYCLKVLQHCAKSISTDELNWMRDFDMKSGRAHIRWPSLIMLLRLLGLPGINCQKIHDQALADLLKLMAKRGCDLNISQDMQRPDGQTQPLLFEVLEYDLVHQTSNLLLRTILQFDHLQLSVTNHSWDNPVEYLLWEWEHRCRRFKVRRRESKNPQPHKIVETIQLLLTHGLDVSEMVINCNFVYHNGCTVILKMLYRAGAIILDNFFKSGEVCKHFTGSLRQEKKEFKKWKEEFDRATRMSLQHMCRLEVRNTLRCGGHLKMLDEVPKSLKDAVLGTVDEPNPSRALTKCEQGFELYESYEDDEYYYEEDDDNDSEDDF